mmetsp:Transcript_20101/g.37574  ORF Transcript_20101/g.37574 Transcript_20101/m.37574 type:complete len:222 (-) Transcript_20101:34-699(-)
MRKSKERYLEQNKVMWLLQTKYEHLSIVECPHHEDLLFGKGQAIMKHPGNVAMRRLLETRLDRWEVAPFKDKSGITWEVVNVIVQGGGRFLKEDGNGWFVQVEDEVARQKVSIAFRDLVKRTRQRRQRRMNDVVSLQQQQQQQQQFYHHQQQQQVRISQVIQHQQSFQSVNSSSSTNQLASLEPLNSHTYEFLGLSNQVPQKRQKSASGFYDCVNGGCWGT